MSQASNTVLSCIQPTSEMHIGNYFGAVANWVRLQDQYPCIYGIVDLHAMTMPFQAEDLRRNTEQMALDLIAAGIDPDKSTLFIQSLVPEHTELYWILSCFCAYGDLSRMTQFKDKSKQIETSDSEFVSAGLFTYPVLQAADILLYRASRVPVGRDQVQHLELSRGLARRMNALAGKILLPEPQVLLTDLPKVASLADPTRKMSKSLGPKHYVGLFDDEESVRSKVKTAVTDVGGTVDGEMSPGVANLFDILSACGGGDRAENLRADHKAGKLKYKDLKDAVADALVELTSRLRDRRAEVNSNRAMYKKLLVEMSDRARAIASATLRDVREAVGLTGWHS